MPIRKPRKREKTTDYVSRVAASEQRHGKKQKQALAIAYSAARKAGRRPKRKRS